MQKRSFPTLLMALATLPIAMAESNLRPLEFTTGPNSWTLELRIDVDAVRSLTVSRELVAAGQSRQVQILPTAFQPGVTKSLLVPLDFDRLVGLPDGLYTQVFTAAGLMPTESDIPYQVRKLQHLRVSGGRVEPLTLRQYSELADPVTVLRFADGRVLREQAGTGLPATQSKLSPRPAAGAVGYDRAVVSTGAMPAVRAVAADDLSRND